MRSVEEWKGKTDDSPIPERVKLRVFERFGGICPMCTRKLQPGKWDCDHIRALVNGGQHREYNLRPLCKVPCHANKTRADVAEKARSHKRRKSNAGIKKPRTIRAWRKFNGELVIAPRER